MVTRSWTPAESQLLDAVSRDRLWRDTQVLGARYRESGSEAERAAVAYICDELRQAGVDFTVYELNAFLSYHRAAECTVLSPAARSVAAVARSYTQPTPPEGLELELVIGSEYQGDRSDKAALVARDWPGGEHAGNARVTIHVQATDEPNLHRGGGTGVWGTPTVQNLPLAKSGPTAINISRPDGEALRDMARRGPVRVRVRTEVETGWRRISFPVATIPGREPTFVLTGGHLDSHDPGVTDNATGCASLLELARLFAARRGELRHGLRIGWWTGHESAGYAGSTWYCDHEWQALHDRCLLYFNIDGPGIKDTTNVEARYVFPQSEAFVLDLIREYFGRDPEIVARPLKMGDQSFWGAGVPSASVYRCLAPDHPDWAVVFGAGHGRWWHSTDDTMDRADPDILADDTRFYALTLSRLLTGERLPFEFATFAAWMGAALEELQSAYGDRLDLSRLLAAVETFAEVATALKAASVDGAQLAARSRADLDDCLMRLSRYLDPVFFTLVGAYDQDLRGAIPGPAVRYPLPSEPPFQPRYFPGLQRGRRLATTDPNTPEYHALYTTILRERNRVGHALAQAIADGQATLARLNARE